MSGCFSTDGRWIAYTSDESGQSEIYVLPYPGPGRKWLVSTAGGFGPKWRRDGKEIFYYAPDLSLMSVEISRGVGLESRAGQTLFQLAAAGALQNLT
jgi:hypothetical protein